MKTMAVAVAVSVVLCTALAGEKTAVKFTKPPTARKANGKTVIEFAVSRQTDVAVYVLNAKGEVVRHLVAGVIGNPSRPSSGSGGGTPPEPLKPGLAQSLAWDGRNDEGRPASGGPFKVRVAAGLTPRHAGYPLEKAGEPYARMALSVGIGVAADGSVYAIQHRPHFYHQGPSCILRFTADGNYAGTLMPFPSSLDRQYTRGLTPVVDKQGRAQTLLSGRFVPAIPHAPALPAMQTPVVLKNGNLLMVSISRIRWAKGGGQTGDLALTELRPEGGTPGTPYARLKLSFPQQVVVADPSNLVVRTSSEMCLALSSDEKYLYMAGLRSCPGGKPLACVYRVLLSGDGKVETFFGDPLKPGSDKRHLSWPNCVAGDGRGHLLVGDAGNDRVVVLKESDGSWVDSFPVKDPHWIGVHAASGAAYVYSKKRNLSTLRRKPVKEPGQLLKFKLPSNGKGWSGAKALAKMELPVFDRGKGRYVFGMSRGAKKARIWIGRYFHGERFKKSDSTLLTCCEDLGGRFSDREGVSLRPGRSRLDWTIFSEPRHRYVVTQMGARVLIDDRTGKVTRRAGRRGGTCKLGPDGLFYGMGSRSGIGRVTAQDKEVPFKAVKSGKWMAKHDEKGVPVLFRELRKGERLGVGAGTFKKWEWPVRGGRLPNAPSGTIGERDFYVDLKGEIYVKNRGRTYHWAAKYDVYDKDGKYLRTALWEVGDSCYGPRLDAQGNLYMAMPVVPKGGFMPEIYKGRKQVGWYRYRYGSIVKFSPRGGAAWGGSPEDYRKEFGFTPPKLAMKTERVSMIRAKGLVADKPLQGALWWRPGFSLLSQVRGTTNCQCNSHSFDTDPFGRTFYPDTLRFRVVVLDTNGNEITHFGTYGNVDQRGPDSWVRDPKTGALRQRTKRDSEALKSPFGEQEFVFGFLNGVAVGEKHIYTTDTLNQRVTRIRMDYGADQTCAIR